MSVTIPTFAKVNTVVMQKDPFIARRIGGMDPISCQGFGKIGDLRDCLQTECQVHIFSPGAEKSLIEPANCSDHLASEHCASHQQTGSSHNAHNIVFN